MTSGEAFGLVSSSSSASLIKVLALNSSAKKPVVGRMVHLDIEMEDGTYKALGTVGNITTDNSTMNDNSFMSAIVRDVADNVTGVDIRTTTVSIQSVYKQDERGRWNQFGSALPSSPPTKTSVRLLDSQNVQEIISNSEAVTYVGRFRGLDAPAPLILPNFSSTRGASHTSIIGKSGGGKTSLATFILSSQMKHENHAIIVIDPQGQWNTENGFVFSVKKFAAGLGREVSSLRVSEDIRLPLSEELLGDLMSRMSLWSNFRRMGKENQDALSREVSSRIAGRGIDLSELENPRELLVKVCGLISQSQSSLDRVYSRGDTQRALQRDLAIMGNSEPLYPEDKDGDIAIVSPEEVSESEERITKILSRFTPIINLFAAHNLTGGQRRPLRGNRGFLTDILQVRASIPDIPAPYVILDMSSDTTNSAKQSYAAGTARLSADEDKSLEQEHALARMRSLLDNSDVKALVITSVLEELKEASETAFASGGGNLNTQVVFDEAWRYAPQLGTLTKETPIYELSSMLEGFALDTRKYGIGWTYILQSPSDLNRGIWRQLSFVYTGHGIQGADKRMLEELMDDKGQMVLYNQFASPASTGLYPFMINGPVSPLIFTSTPTFINVYTKLEDYLSDNAIWIDEITQRRGKPFMSKSAADLSLLSGNNSNISSFSSQKEGKGYIIGGGHTKGRAEPQTKKPILELPAEQNPSSDSLPRKVLPPPF